MFCVIDVIPLRLIAVGYDFDIAAFSIYSLHFIMLKSSRLIRLNLQLKGNEAPVTTSNDIRDTGPEPVRCLIEPSIRLKRLKQFRL